MQRLILNLDEIHYLQIEFCPYPGEIFRFIFYTACFGIDFKIYNPNENYYYHHQQWIARAYGLEDDGFNYQDWPF